MDLAPVAGGIEGRSARQEFVITSLPPSPEPAGCDHATAVLRDLLPRIEVDCARGGRGWCAAVACVLEAAAPKPGNVHPGAAFADLAFPDLVAAALASAPHLDRAPGGRLGGTILAAVTAARAVTRSNANFGIVLALAPLAAARVPAAAAVAEVLGALVPADAADVWQAIAVAGPGGLGRVDRCDVAGEPPPDLLDAMRLAAPRDALARLWAEGYAPLFTGPVADIAGDLALGWTLTDAIVRGFLRQLERMPDSLVARRHGPEVAADVSRRAAGVLAATAGGWRAELAAFDRSLREPRRINPGTTADLIAAALYILARQGRLPLGAASGTDQPAEASP